MFQFFVCFDNFWQDLTFASSQDIPQLQICAAQLQEPRLSLAGAITGAMGDGRKQASEVGVVASEFGKSWRIHTRADAWAAVNLLSGFVWK